MDNMLNQLEKAYGFHIIACTAAPRGFWAETFYINTGDGEKYFLKLHKNYPWEFMLPESLAVQEKLSDKVCYVPKPLRTRNNALLYTLDDQRKASVFTYIDGENYLAKDVCEVMELMAGIYKLNISCNNIYKYKLYPPLGTIETKSEALNDYLKRNLKIYESLRDEYERLYDKLCAANRPMYTTHGDVAKNLMLDKNNRKYIIDWDRIRMGPAELDLYEFIDKYTDIEKLNRVAVKNGLEWRFDKEVHNYFVLNTLYYNLRNLLNSNIDGITADALKDYQGYVDKMSVKLIY